jgi:hypothetical protein
VVQEDAQTEVYEFVAFKAVLPTGGGGFVTVLQGGVVLSSEVTRQAMFVTNLIQVCE